MQKYYQIPVQFSKISKGQRAQKTETEQSIQEFIHLIIMTNLNEYKRDNQFGCKIWQSEFEILPNDSRWIKEIEKLLLESITCYEKRLRNIKITIHTGVTKVSMKKIVVLITGELKETAEAFKHQETIYLCPKSTDE